MPTFVSTVKVMGKQFHGKACRSKKEAQHDVAKIAYNALKDCPPDERRPDDDERVAPKKLKTGPPLPLHLPPLPERELPEYPFDKSFNAGNFTSGPTFDHQLSSPPSRLDRHEGWKWEGIIAMSGTPVFRAHCFPVGKVLDMPPLPGLLDCTAKISLDMLLKHYYEAVGVWIVFFLPESDVGETDLYKQLMHYLEQKKLVSVSNLDNNSTLFLVPPSNFTEKVLKVPGSRFIISGVILRFDCSGIPLYGNTSNSYNLEIRHFDPLSPQRGVNGNQQFAGSSLQLQEDAEGDPENVYKQQLAADLLKQIQKGKGT